MSVELKVPPVGESITEVTIGEWLKAEGDWVDVDQDVVVVESDKVNMEVPAPAAGFLRNVSKATGDTANIGEVLAEIEPGDRPAKSEATVSGEAHEEAGGSKAAPKDASKESKGEAKAEAAGDSAGGEPARVTPAARRVLAESGLDAAAVKATGPGGRLLKEDVQRHLGASQGAASGAQSAPAMGARSTEAVRMSPMRKTVARRLLEAQQTAALLTTFNEIDMTAVMDLRAQYKQTYVDRYGVKLGFMSFFVKAVIEGLKAFPAVNARIDGEELIYHHYYDIGVAIGGGKGLVVPVIRDAERLSFAQIESTIVDFGTRAKANKIKLDELKGGTFSITNGGVYGSLLSTPIVNPPQSGILGMHGIQDRPIALDGQVVIRPMMYVALTYDHRIVDGREAVSFLKMVKDTVEQPVRILLEV